MQISMRLQSFGGNQYKILIRFRFLFFRTVDWYQWDKHSDITFLHLSRKFSTSKNLYTLWRNISFGPHLLPIIWCRISCLKANVLGDIAHTTTGICGTIIGLTYGWIKLYIVSLVRDYLWESCSFGESKLNLFRWDDTLP